MSRPGPAAAELAEIERLRLQAAAWTATSDAFLDAIGLGPGAAFVELGCGPLGVLELASRRVGPAGRVTGVDHAPLCVAAAQVAAALGGWANVTVRAADATATGLPAGRFDAVYGRFLCQAAGAEPVLREMRRLARAGGVVALEEPGGEPWSIDPPPEGYAAIEPEVRAVFLPRPEAAGAALADRFRDAGLEPAGRREARLTLRGGDPYAAMPLHALRAARPALLAAGRHDAATLDGAAAELERAAAEPRFTHRSFSVIQVWARLDARAEAGTPRSARRSRRRGPADHSG